MNIHINSVGSLADEELLRDIENAAARERGATTHLIALLAEMDARRLYLQQGYSSLFVFCTACLRLSEHAASGRIEAARAARKFPLILDRLEDGSITLTTICLLSNHLTADNHLRLLDAATHKSRREVEEQVAALRPLPAIPPAVRKLPQSKAAAANVVAPPTRESADKTVASSAIVGTAVDRPTVPPSAPPVVRALAPDRYKVQFTIGAETHRKLRTLQDLMRHAVAKGDVGEIFDRAITLLLRDVERRRLASAEHTRTTGNASATSRHIAASVKREVWARDNGQCAFVGMKGRCEERGFLEFHHVIPFADGGQTTVDNLQLRCRAHNDYEAREYFGSMLIREWSSGSRDPMRA